MSLEHHENYDIFRFIVNYPFKQEVGTQIKVFRITKLQAAECFFSGLELNSAGQSPSRNNVPHPCLKQFESLESLETLTKSFAVLRGREWVVGLSFKGILLSSGF